MIESFNVPVKNVSKWAGFSSTAFSLSQAITGVFWGRGSDYWGRKPMILAGLCSALVASLLFGFSTSLWMAIAARSLAGAASGNVGIMRTVIAELVPQKELQPRAFSILPTVYTVGGIFGPGLGGILANPAKAYPKTFGNSVFFQAFPYALPNIVTGIFFIISILIGFLFLNETLDDKKNERDYGRSIGRLLSRAIKPSKARPSKLSDNDETTPLLKPDKLNEDITARKDNKRASQPAIAYREVFSYQSSINLITYALLDLHSVAYIQLLPVFMHFPQQQDRTSNPDVQLPLKFAGGFGIESDRIGVIFTLYGIVCIFVQIFVFTVVARRFGILPCFRVAVTVFPFTYIVTPFTSLLPTPLMQQIGIFLIMITRACALIFALPCSCITLTNSAANLRILGILNGVATSVSAIGRAIGPAVGGYSFSLGMELGYGILPWWILAFLSIIAAIPVWFLLETDSLAKEDGLDSRADDSLATNTEPSQQLDPQNRFQT